MAVPQFGGLKTVIQRQEAMTLELYQHCLDLSHICDSELIENKMHNLDSDETESGSPEVEPGQG